VVDRGPDVDGHALAGQEATGLEQVVEVVALDGVEAGQLLDGLGERQQDDIGGHRGFRSMVDEAVTEVTCDGRRNRQ
jgi:hypothetical protein